MNTNSDHKHQSHGGVVCPNCLYLNTQLAAFCADCGAPIGMVASIDPIQRIQAEGFAYRSAVDGPPRFIIAFGIWLLFSPIVIATAIILPNVIDDFPYVALAAFFLLSTVGLAAILWRKIANSIVKPRPAGEGITMFFVDLGIWLLFATIPMAVVIIPIYLLSDKILDAVIFLLLTLPAVGSTVMLYRTTKNYIVKSRAADDRVSSSVG